MKVLIGRIRRLKEQVEAEIADRQNYFFDRKEEWQQSAKGEEYQARTRFAIELQQDLIRSITNLSE